MFERELHLETKQSGVPSDVLSAAVHRAADNETSPISLRQIVLQARLSVGPSGDRYEREADAVADRVVRFLRTRAQPRRRTPGRPSSLCGGSSVPRRSVSVEARSIRRTSAR